MRYQRRICFFVMTTLVVALAADPSSAKDAPTAKPNGDAKPASDAKPATDKPAEKKLFNFREITLDNGLRVITLEDFSCPIVNVQVWYHVGSKDENPERQGFAHMFEHMMFRGTERLGPTDHMDLIRQVGGECNAYTSFDQTVYHETLASHELQLALWLEADAGVTSDTQGRVSMWADQSGNNHNVSANLIANQPILNSNALGGKPALIFNGTSDYFTINGQVLTSQQFTILAVVADTRAKSDGGDREIFSNWSTAHTTDSIFFGTRDNPVNARFSDN